MSKVDIFSAKGIKKPSGVTLPQGFDEKENLALLSQAIRVYEDALHPGLSYAKTRSDVEKTGAKVWRQKGTGNARHGSRSAPIFVGGGKAHGPKGVKRELGLPQKMRQKALKIALSQKVKEGKLLIVDGISSIKKTKDANSLIGKIKKGQKIEENTVTIFLASENKTVHLPFRNIEGVKVSEYGSANAYSVYFGGLILLDKEALKKK